MVLHFKAKNSAINVTSYFDIKLSNATKHCDLGILFFTNNLAWSAHIESIIARTYILNNYTVDYKTRLTQLKLLPMMYVFELQDFLFLIRSLKTSNNGFDISNHVC